MSRFLEREITMRKEFFTNCDGKKLVRINKKTAHKFYIEGKTIYGCPVNCNPQYMVKAIYWLFTMDKEAQEKFWNHMLDSIAYYNCNKEMGYYLKFYTEFNTYQEICD